MKTSALLPLLLLAVSCAHSEPVPPANAGSEPPPPAPQAEKAAAPEVIAVRVLLVAKEGRTADEALERARMLSEMARQGEKLSELIRTYSDRAGAAEDQGLFKLQTADPVPFERAVADAALAVPIGGISQPIAVAAGYLVLERLPDPPGGPERIAARHILITYAGSPQQVPGATRSEAEARALAQSIVDKARAAGADWNALAQEYTEEPGGKERSGDLGRFGRGQMVRAFEQAAFALKVGEVSGVVQSPFGFHVIQRYE
ncbi:MAG TPA: peptidylprolyl isomerase [Polyangiales bacterium]|nr:peptidylprolyl isomerase [Polyangiales bacterium]